jgi:3-isopropylmalate/(R)-2-methylmalate dehydratase large subunit
MGMTITEKILARASENSVVRPGQIIEARIDWLMTNDATTHVSVDLFHNGVKRGRVFRPEKTVFIIDHNVPSESTNTTRVQNIMRRFAREHGCLLHDGDGVCHQLMIEKYVRPGQVVIAADSHTPTMGALGAFGAGVGSTDFTAAMVTGGIWLMVPPTLRFELTGRFKQGVYARDLILTIIGDIGSDGAVYKAMEFGGPAMTGLTIDDRMVLCNLSAEAGAKNGIVEPDLAVSTYLDGRHNDAEKIAHYADGRHTGAEKIAHYAEGRPDHPAKTEGTPDGRRENAAKTKDMYLPSDPDCEYEHVYSYDLGDIEPMVAQPHFVHNRAFAAGLQKRDIRIDQGFIGSCSNGRIEELRTAAVLLKGRKIKPGVKLLITPASRAVQLQALREGLVEIFMEAGAMVLNPNCSVCWGACQGVLGPGETMISTGTRNFKGRAGSPDSSVYLASAATVAVSCLEGRITDPRAHAQEVVT